jgi:hypothetical protein
LEQSEEGLPKTKVQFNDEEILKEKRKGVIPSFLPSYFLSSFLPFFLPSFLPSFFPSFLSQYYPRREKVYVALMYSQMLRVVRWMK